MDCYLCKTELIWGGDHTYEDYGMDGDGVVANLSCPNESCDVETVLVHMNNDGVAQRPIDPVRDALEKAIEELVDRRSHISNPKIHMKEFARTAKIKEIDRIIKIFRDKIADRP